MKDDYAYTDSHCLTYTFLFKRLGECTFWTWEWKEKWYSPKRSQNLLWLSSNAPTVLFPGKRKKILFLFCSVRRPLRAPGHVRFWNAECKVCALALSTMIISAGNILAEAQGKIMRLLKSSNETWPRIIYSLDWSGNNNSLFWGWFSLLLNIRKVFRNLAYLSSAQRPAGYTVQ